MSGFSADWLRLREPCDLAAREAAAASLDLPGLRGRCALAPDALFPVLDLGCGTGANLRYLAPRLGGRQRWWLVDHDPELLAELPRALQAWAAAQGYWLRGDTECLRLSGAGFEAELHPVQADLVQDLAALPLPQARLVTASALLDLASAVWLGGLAARCQASRAALLFALNVDGRIAWEPRDADDEAVLQLFAAHQRRDKGFGGPALAGGAVPLLAAELKAAGHRVVQAESDWRIEPGALQRALVEGMAGAALEQAPDAHTLVSGWRERRVSASAALRVGHLELLAWPVA
ncbi:class I SAM-dependent methyltransferase [Aquabacterium sp. A7-Y]|uniref:class I SAM-dependent methyltransferase n=1 Tax=Aquabacterium sp. A7-Y TaxID=1349605 RepID=UPI00223E732A|nr:class I SAM-dependent methyltransferase [Aquabacterium sp. A7-Y]MCW7542134.1 class I SAM-dependent methyltransferase [Aquabacterium sp. A7-Y]